MLRNPALLAIAVTCLMATSPAEARGLSVSIVRTAHGIPHIRATNWQGIGYGVGYAYGQDNLCLIAEEFATIAGERSLHFGAKAGAVLGFEPVDNLSSDLFFRSAINLPALRKSWRKAGKPERQLFTGYVAGHNRLLRDLGAAGVPVACRGKPWVRPITLDDLLRLNEKQMLLAGSLNFAPAVANAAPPLQQTAVAASIALPDPHDTGIGSNGWAFGAETTANGRGLVVGNPHFPWFGPARFWQMHVTIPGIIDAMGVGIAGTPLPTLGFNQHIAWTHTVTAARHFTLHALQLDPQDPTAYLVDGKRHAMLRRTISVPMADGAAPITRTLYSSRFGQLLAAPATGLGWSGTSAYALKEANAGNQRGIGTWIKIARARSTADIRMAVESSLGIPWVNTIAADAQGNALLADVTAVPNVSAAKVAACATPLSQRLALRLTLLDGSRSACDWETVRGTPVAGLMPARDQAVFESRDYLANSNDSYWLTTPKAPAKALSPILGAAETERTLRTRSGLIEIGRRLAGTDGLPGTRLDHANAKAMAFANKSLAAELTLAPLLALCATDATLAPACAALVGWDGRFNNDSRGAYLFHAYWEKTQQLPGLWATPFSLADPVNTPRDFITSGEQGVKLRALLAEAVARLAKEGIALDARWGDVQTAPRGAERIAIHGADGPLGVLNVQRSIPVPGGLMPVHGSSYVQVVGFDDAGPVADAVLSYSQSTDPASPWYADQTRAYSAKRWHRLPFTAAQIAADSPGPVLELKE